MKRMSDFESVTKGLQKNSGTLADARSSFDEVPETYGQPHGHLGTKASIVENKAFETEVVKVQHGERTCSLVQRIRH